MSKNKLASTNNLNMKKKENKKKKTKKSIVSKTMKKQFENQDENSMNLNEDSVK